MEFDTSESAIEWRRELQEAVFLYRSRRKEMLYGYDSPSTPETASSRRENAGVRICIPLHRIQNVVAEQFLDFAKIISISIDDDQTPKSGTEDKPPSLREFKFLVIQSDSGPALCDFVDTARSRYDSHRQDPFPPSADMVTIDFGPLVSLPSIDSRSTKHISSRLTFADVNESDVLTQHPRSEEGAKATRQSRLDALEKRMKKMFALKDDLDVFSMYTKSILNSHDRHKLFF